MGNRDMEVQRQRMKVLALISIAILGGCASRNAEVLERYANHQVPVADSDAALKVTFMGTTTLLFQDRNNAVLIDGFFSRPSKLRVVLGSVEPDEAKIRSAIQRAGIQQLDAIYVAHSHYDHAMDVAVVAAITGAKIYGSSSTFNIATGGGIPNGQAVLPTVSTSSGGFVVSTFKSLHSPDARYEGVVSSPLRPPARVSAYKEGGSYSYLIEHRGHRFLVHPSANYVKGIYTGVRADVVFLSIGALGKQSDDFIKAYWREVVETTGAVLVVPVHWDDFTLPVKSNLPLAPRPFDDVERAMAKIKQLAGDSVRLAIPPAFTPMDICRNIPCEHSALGGPAADVDWRGRDPACERERISQSAH